MPGDRGQSSRIPSDRVYRIGVAPWMMDKPQKKSVEVFLAVLEKSGYSAKANLEIKVDDAAGNERVQEQIIRDFVDWNADLIYVLSAQGALIAQETAKDIPIVFSGVGYPQELGLVERLEFSGNQMVGVRSYVPVEEQMAFLGRLVSQDIRRLGVCFRTDDDDSRLFLDEIRALASKQGIALMRIEAQDAGSFRRLLAQEGPGADALYLGCDDLMQGAGAAVAVDFAAPRGIPILSCGSNAVSKGALAGAVVDEEQSAQLAAGHAIQILDGRRPTSLQTLTVSTPRLLVNSGAARALRIRMPQVFMGEEVHVIE